ncbi:hypothetical protein AVEN_231993-1 [Araneus ventricosus]|uniref:Uncharacterized protein n=1 Tax=Araneus ventricosus TaxID=182803 RepID=A0A4Y2C2I8_ARAVE|nr:hypothetical protein AVEN_231993-1 [Araneus ventricosus]
MNVQTFLPKRQLAIIQVDIDLGITKSCIDLKNRNNIHKLWQIRCDHYSPNYWRFGLDQYRCGDGYVGRGGVIVCKRWINIFRSVLSQVGFARPVFSNFSLCLEAGRYPTSVWLCSWRPRMDLYAYPKSWYVGLSAKLLSRYFGLC